MSATPTATALPSGISPPLAVDNDNDHGGLVIIFTGISLFLAFWALGMRIVAATKRQDILRHELFIATLIFAFIQISLVLVQVHLGWGKTDELLNLSQISTMKKVVYATDILYIIVLGLSKIDTTILYGKLSLQPSAWMSNFILIASGIWMISSILLLAIRCDATPWEDINRKCGGLLPRWIVIAVLDILLDAIISVYPIKIMHKLQVALNKKISVLSILACRVLLIPLSALHLYYIHVQVNSTDPTLIGSYATSVEEIHVAFNVLLLNMSSVKYLLAAYEDENKIAYTREASHSQSHSNSGVISKSKMFTSSRSRTTRNSKHDRDNMEEPILPNGQRQIMKSVQISVDHEAIELQNRSTVHPNGLY